jgi:threonine synthase
MIQSGGFPVVVSEERLVTANDLASTVAGLPADHTGTAGLAGLLQLFEEGLVGPDENVLVLFTGARR